MGEDWKIVRTERNLQLLHALYRASDGPPKTHPRVCLGWNSVSTPCTSILGPCLIRLPLHLRVLRLPSFSSQNGIELQVQRAQRKF